MRSDSLTAEEARRLALSAQGLLSPRRPAADGRSIARIFRSVRLVQIDSVNVLVRAHYLPFFSRLGPYSRSALDRVWRHRPLRLFEYWGHEASLIPIELHHLLRWRMEKSADRQLREFAAAKAPLVRRVLAEVERRGPLAASDLRELGAPGTGSWWGWSDAKRALEWLFLKGELTCLRRGTFERVYELSERVLPASVLARSTPSVAEAQRELLRIAAGAGGVVCAEDLREYFRLPAAEARPRVEELIEAGELVAVEVEGWDRPGYLAPGASIPRRADGCALIGPFDSVLWGRRRLHRLFGFDFRIEMYTPAPKRRYGYYVLPFLLGDRFAARVDLKADRRSSHLVVNAVHLEPGAPTETGERIEAEIGLLADWLGLDGVERRHLGGCTSAAR